MPTAPALLPRAQMPRSRFADGDPGTVLQAARDALTAGQRPVLAVVVETEGSTYAAPGTLALFGEARPHGWISGGCLEPEIARLAMDAAATQQVGWLEIDTTDDGALFLGSAVGCRGRQLIALLPLAALRGIDTALQAWLADHQDLTIVFGRDGDIDCRIGARRWHWRLPSEPVPPSAVDRWPVVVRRAPAVLVLGTGPETPVLAPMLRTLGWRVVVADARDAWRARVAPDIDVIEAAPTAAIAAHADADVALVMHHSFEADRNALEALADSRIPFIGLLGPERRRRDLFKLLRAEDRDPLAERLQSPVGVPGCGRGAAAIALSIATQLQLWRGVHA
ncbi:XdhC family protein [Luteimonas sp. TWI662]|uniref:XdhC family protein n=1 Tax=Luteimonas sp. TWI662 TaxID=3136789 RepID=UPI003208F75C